MRHKLKRVHLWMNQNYSQIKHVLVVIVGTMLLIFAMVSLGNQNRLLEKASKQAEQIERLSQENKRLNTQSRNIAKQNQKIAKLNQAYTLCIAEIFAMYTHDFIPINISDFEACARNNTFDAGASNAQGEPQQSSSPSLSSEPSSNTTPQNRQPQSNNSQPGNGGGGNSDPPLLDCKVDLLGIHLGCP